MKPLLYDNEIIDVPEYKTSTKTGRVGIKKGFNFLTLKKTNRKKLKPIDSDNLLFEIDFISCEPNFYIKTMIEKDLKEKNVYQYIINKFDLDIDIKKFKNCLIALLYGAAIKTVKKLSGIDYQKIIKIKNYLNIEEFKNMINDEYYKSNMFLNYYNRPVLSNDNPVNYWIQSSVADFCCLAFNEFLKEYNFINVHAFIHDAIIISCHKSRIDTIQKITKIYEPISNISLPVKIKMIST
jgi:hypothetical protein